MYGTRLYIHDARTSVSFKLLLSYGLTLTYKISLVCLFIQISYLLERFMMKCSYFPLFWLVLLVRNFEFPSTRTLCVRHSVANTYCVFMCVRALWYESRRELGCAGPGQKVINTRRLANFVTTCFGSKPTTSSGDLPLFPTLLTSYTVTVSTLAS